MLDAIILIAALFLLKRDRGAIAVLALVVLIIVVKDGRKPGLRAAPSEVGMRTAP